MLHPGQVSSAGKQTAQAEQSQSLQKQTDKHIALKIQRQRQSSRPHRARQEDLLLFSPKTSYRQMHSKRWTQGEPARPCPPCCFTHVLQAEPARRPRSPMTTLAAILIGVSPEHKLYSRLQKPFWKATLSKTVFSCKNDSISHCSLANWLIDKNSQSALFPGSGQGVQPCLKRAGYYHMGYPANKVFSKVLRLIQHKGGVTWGWVYEWAQ